MGHVETYMEAVQWHPDLSPAERRARGPFMAEFGFGRAERARAALVVARRDAELAAEVAATVKRQAVYACLREGLTVRAVAELLKIPKSDVGRIAKDRPHYGSGIGPLGRYDLDRFRDLVRRAWGHS